MERFQSSFLDVQLFCFYVISFDVADREQKNTWFCLFVQSGPDQRPACEQAGRVNTVTVSVFCPPTHLLFLKGVSRPE